MKNKDIAMQVRCVHCKAEQYSPMVYMISLGKAECPWCGKKSKEMTNDEYQEVFKLTQNSPK